MERREMGEGDILFFFPGALTASPGVKQPVAHGHSASPKSPECSPNRKLWRRGVAGVGLGPRLSVGVVFPLGVGFVRAFGVFWASRLAQSPVPFEVPRRVPCAGLSFGVGKKKSSWKGLGELSALPCKGFLGRWDPRHPPSLAATPTLPQSRYSWPVPRRNELAPCPCTTQRASSPAFYAISLFPQEISPNQLNRTLSKEMEAKSLWPRAPGTSPTLFHSSLKDYLEFDLAGKVGIV